MIFKFFLALFVIGIGIAILVSLAALCCTLWADAADSLEDIGFRREKEYRKGYAQGWGDAAKYPMGIYTFPIACSHCKNLNSDKCYRCKEEIASGFELKVEEES